jgi:PAS domain S-box-containing protein
MDQKETAKNSLMETPHDYRRRTDVERTSIPVMSADAELRVTLETTGLGIFDYYPLTDDLYWSDAAKAHFGLSPDAHVNYNLFLVALHPDDRKRVDMLIHNALHRENDGSYSAEYRAVGIEDGKERWIAARGRAFFNKKGEAVRFIAITSDITDSRKMD